MKVSIVISTYNRSNLLREAVESVLAQTYSPLEVIVVDDGSTDDTAAVMAAYAGRVQYIRQDNAGVSAARNRGFAAAQGDLIGFLDDDDIFLPQKIERQVALLAAQPELGLVHCRYYIMGSDGTYLSKVGLLPSGEVLEQLVCQNFLWMSGPLIRRERLEAAGGFDPALSSAADYDLWVRIAGAGYPFGCVQEPVGAYRVHANSMVTNMALTEREVLISLNRFFGHTDLPLQLQQRAYATWYFWFSRRYYALDSSEDGRRSLAEALRLYPALLEDRAGFLEMLCIEALDVRVTDPFAFIHRVFEYLPPAAETIHSAHDYVLSRVYRGVALRLYARGAFAAAQSHMAEAIRLHPAMLDQPDDFARACVDCAVGLPATSESYIRDVLNHLPPEAAAFQALHGRLISDLAVAHAFEHYHNGNRDEAGRKMLRALRHRPAWAKNRGVLAVLAKSLPDVISRRRE